MRLSKRTLLGAACALFGLTALASGAAMLWERDNLVQAERAFDTLRQEVAAPAEQPAPPPPAEAGQPAGPESSPFPAPAPSPYAGLKERNPDLAGWVRIEGTGIDYPVMQTPEDGEYYLRRGFDRRYSFSGTPFADPASDLSGEGGNIIVYGHNLRDGAMFSGLLDYRDYAYWQEHPLIRFDTMDSSDDYRIVTVVQASAEKENPDAFDFTAALRLGTEEEFDAFLARCAELSLYTTGETARYSDRLLILATCEYSQQNGRMILIAKQLP